jgi:hypothetical protein
MWCKRCVSFYFFNFYLFFSSSCHLRYVYNNNKNSDYRVAVVPMCRDEGRQKETSLCYRSIQLSVGYDFWWFVSAFVFVIVDGGRRARRECENTGRLRTSAGRARTVCGQLERVHDTFASAGNGDSLSCDIRENFFYDATSFPFRSTRVL